MHQRETGMGRRGARLSYGKHALKEEHKTSNSTLGELDLISLHRTIASHTYLVTELETLKGNIYVDKYQHLIYLMHCHTKPLLCDNDLDSLS